MAIPKTIVVVIIDDDVSFGDDLALELEYESRGKLPSVKAHAYAEVDRFIDDLDDKKFKSVDFVILDEDAEEFGGGSRHQGSQINLPKLYAVRQTDDLALKKCRFVVYSGKLDDEELNSVRAQIGTLGGDAVWPKTQYTAQDFYERIQRRLSEDET